ncbi:MAG: hypothetical protein NWP90_07140, partial [Flavobacterium sp.]|nr:hypothetical protein [Flavobacterium sp.]
TNQNYNNPEYAVEAFEMAGNGYVRKDYILFKGKKYDEYSLLNRNTFDFSVISNEQDSLNRIEVKTWLFNNNAGAVQKLQADYLKLIQEHNLATNLTANKWFEIQIFPKQNPSSTPFNGLIQISALSSLLTTAIIYDSNMAFGF